MTPHPLIWTMAFLALLPSLPAAAADSVDYKDLKVWCIERNKWSKEGRKRDFPHPEKYFHYHHYCFSMEAYDKALVAMNHKDLKFYVGEVVNNVDYVLGHVGPEHPGRPLFPEAYTLRARALLLIHNNTAAELNLLTALQLDPKYDEPMTLLAQLYLDTNRADKAKEKVRDGLTLAPRNKKLRRLASQLAIPLPQMEPEPMADSADKNAVSINQASPVNVPVEANSTQKSNAPRNQETSNPTTPIGASTNPWCRFCPDAPAAPAGTTPSTPGVTPKAAP